MYKNILYAVNILGWFVYYYINHLYINKHRIVKWQRH